MADLLLFILRPICSLEYRDDAPKPPLDPEVARQRRERRAELLIEAAMRQVELSIDSAPRLGAYASESTLVSQPLDRVNFGA
jgi:hypothetical protein